MKHQQPSRRVPELTWLHRLGGNAFVNTESRKDWSRKIQVPAANRKTCQVTKGQCLVHESLFSCAKLGILARSQPFQEDTVGLRLIFTFHKLLFFISLRSNFALGYFIQHGGWGWKSTVFYSFLTVLSFLTQPTNEAT